MDLIPLIAIPVLYVGIAYVKPHLKDLMPWNICAICIAVGATWLGLLIAWILNAAISPIMIGILIGMSIAGIMYKAEVLYKKREIRNFWFVRLVIVIGGFYLTYFALTERWGAVIVIAIFAIIAIVVASSFFQGLTHEDAVKEAGKDKDSSLLKKLDNCC